MKISIPLLQSNKTRYHYSLNTADQNQTMKQKIKSLTMFTGNSKKIQVQTAPAAAATLKRKKTSK